VSRGFPDYLRSAVSASAAPYGYTLTVWTSGAVTMHELGTPNVWRALLFLAGAVAGFAAVAALAHGSPDQTFAERELHSVRLWGGFHVVSVGLAIGAAGAISAWPGGVEAWPLVGCAATAIYLVGLAAQFTLADVERLRVRGADVSRK
jgi:hypothetical protein